MRPTSELPLRRATPESVEPPLFAVVGNPNSGKSTLFNALTGLRQKVGNYPGVTVEKKTGQFYSLHGKPIQLIDLPGAYSLVPRSPDEAITRDVLLGRVPDTPRPNRVICIVDASNLERNLFLVTQVLDLGLPTILVLNMVDLAEAKGISISVEALSRELGIPVVACQAHKAVGLAELKRAMTREDIPRATRRWTAPPVLDEGLKEIADSLRKAPCPIPDQPSPEESWAHAVLLLTQPEVEEDSPLPSTSRDLAKSVQRRLQKEGVDSQEAVVSARYEFIQRVCSKVIRTHGPSGLDDSDRLDTILTHPIWGWVVFLGVMALMFLSIFTLATYPMDWVESGIGAIADGIRSAMPEGDLRDLLTDGVVAGVGGVLVFLPQILILFFFIGLLEDTGYMARAAFIMDRVMSRVGLHGKSFIPLLSSYACAIPGIMATRTIEHPKDRLVTILVAPLMSCSARLPVYSIMIATLLPSQSVSVLKKAALMLGLYAIGTGATFFFAWLFKKTIMRSVTPVLIMELPPYRMPSLRSVCMQMLSRSQLFVRRAGTVILGLSILLWFLAAYPKSATADPTQQLSQSFAGRLGHALEPIIKPLGFDWKIGIGLVGSFAAREVFVSTMSIVYNVENEADDTLPLRDAMLREKWPDGSNVFTPLVCVSLLLFYVLALQCISTVAVVRRETNGWRWPLFQLGYLTGVAYLASLVVYQGGRWLGF